MNGLFTDSPVEHSDLSEYPKYPVQALLMGVSRGRFDL